MPIVLRAELALLTKRAVANHRAKVGRRTDAKSHVIVYMRGC